MEATTRPAEEGGGETSTYPFEDWRYRYFEGIGENVELEFVDPTMSGEYKLTMDPSEKDALLYVPGRRPDRDGVDGSFEQAGSVLITRTERTWPRRWV